MRKAFKYRLYPTPVQTKRLEQTLEECRWLYNNTLAYRRDTWEQEGRSASWYETKRRIPQLKEERPSLGVVHSQVLQDVTARVDLAFQGFFRRLKAKGEKAGYPRFKGKGRYDSFTYPQSGYKIVGDGTGKYRRLRLSKIGDVKIVLHREIVGTIKTLTVQRTATGKWYACFSCEVEAQPLPSSPKVVGVDIGLESFATTSTGEHIPNPRFFKAEEKALAKAQRKLSECAKGTPEYRRQKQVVARVHERMANKRRDFAHKLSRRLVDEFQVIAFEDLDIQDMQNGNWRSMNRSISDAAWRQLRDMTAAKAEEAGRTVVEVEPRGTSQRCSQCGAHAPKDLSVRVHKCTHCGFSTHRDHNASLNILGLGLQSLGLNPRSSPVYGRE